MKTKGGNNVCLLAAVLPDNFYQCIQLLLWLCKVGGGLVPTLSWVPLLGATLWTCQLSWCVTASLWFVVGTCPEQ